MLRTLALTAAALLATTSLAAETYVKANAARKTATLTVVANADASNSGLNFNGASKGEKTFVVPVGWNVELKFSNLGTMPHSVVLIEEGKIALSYDADKAAFKGAFSKDPLRGVVKGDAAETLKFAVNKPGKYLLICGVMGHGMGGQYINLEVSSTAKTASYK